MSGLSLCGSIYPRLFPAFVRNIVAFFRLSWYFFSLFFLFCSFVQGCRRCIGFVERRAFWIAGGAECRNSGMRTAMCV